MAHLIFIARNRDLASYLLTGPAVLGRSVESDIYVPDVFVSRQHCRFEKLPDGWVIVDQRSRNGIFYNGRRIYRRAMKHGDLIEIGSFTIRFHQGDIPANMSSMTPFGEGTAVASLMDTLFSGGMRPSEYLKKSQRKPAWVRAREEAEESARRAQLEAEEAARAEAERLNFNDAIELDMELQIGKAAEAISPQYVLVSRDLAAKFADLVRDGVSASPVSDLAESIAATTVAIPNEERADTGIGAITVAPRGEIGLPSGGGPGKPGAMQNMFADVYRDVTPLSDKERKARDKELAKREKEAAALEKKQRKEAGYSNSQPLGERFREWYDEAKTTDVSVNGLIELIRSKPKPFAIAATILLVLGGGWEVRGLIRPKYNMPKGLTPEQVEKMQRDANAG